MVRTVPGPRWTYALVGAAVGVLLLAGFGPPGLLLPHSETCQLGPSIGTYTIWSPQVLVNIPDGGNVTEFDAGFNYAMSSGSLHVGTSPNVLQNIGIGLTLSTAGILGAYVNANWTFYRTENVSTVGSDSNPCTQPYVARFAGFTGAPRWCEGYGIVPIAVNSSDATEPHVWNGTDSTTWHNYLLGCPYSTPGASVWFDTSFHAGGTGTAGPYQLNLCGRSGTYPIELDSSAAVPVVLTVPYRGGNVSASGYLTWVGDPNPYPAWYSTATYSLPMGWVWEIAPLGPVTSTVNPPQSIPSGLLAFERLSCPS